MRVTAVLGVLGALLMLSLWPPDPAAAQQTDSQDAPTAETVEPETEDEAAAPTGEKEWPGDPLVAQIQHGLRELGYELSVVDGLIGPNTRSTIRAFQEDQGLEPTGAATDALKRAIEQRLFRKSQEAEKLWAETRLYLRAQGYAPGDGAFDSEPAQAALSSFAEDHWLELERSFSERLHEVIARATRADTEAQDWLCRHHMDAKAYAQAFDWCRRAAGKEVREAQYYVGWMLYYGRGVEQSYDEAFKWYRAAARAGDPRAMTFVGLMYRLGRGVERNPDAAQQWYRRAVEAGG